MWLFAIALALHNIPEGLAIGVGVASGDAEISWPVTWAIAVQNVPAAGAMLFVVSHEIIPESHREAARRRRRSGQCSA